MKVSIWELLEEKFDIDELEQLGISFNRKTIVVQTDSLINDGKKHKITPHDVIYYYSHDARNLSSGCRRLGKIVGDWRNIDYLAKLCLEIYIVLKDKELRKEAKRYDLTPRW